MARFYIPIRAQLTAFVAVLILLLVGLAGLAATRFHAAEQAVQELDRTWLAAQNLLGDVRVRLVRLRTSETYRTFVAGDVGAEAVTAQMLDHREALHSLLKKSEPLFEHSVVATDAAILRDSLNAYLLAHDAWTTDQTARTRNFYRSYELYMKSVAFVEQMIQKTQRVAGETGQEIDGLLREAGIVMLVVSIAGVMLGGWLLFHVRERITRPLGAITYALSRLAQGDKDVAVPERNRRDEIGDLANAFEIFRANALALDDARKAAEAASASKSAFLANMSHEIRTPLNGIMGMAQVLDGSELTDQQREFVSTILQSGKTLTMLLNDVLDLSKIEAGKLAINSTDADLREVLRSQHQLWTPRAEENGLELRLAFDADLPRRLSFDPIRVQQCVANLVSNAIKFTQSGRVEIFASARPLEGNSHLVTIRIADTGPGIDTATLAKLFRPFVQADETTRRAHGGTGLGLSITRRLAELMGGTATADSEPGRGSVFSISFIAGPATNKAETPSSAPGHRDISERLKQSRLRILVVEDHPINRQIVGLFLRTADVDVVEARNGVEALEALEREPFDLVLLDMHMPIMDGPTTIGEIRASRHSWANIPVIALTADAMRGDRERYLAMGMDGYLSKPLAERDLLSEIARVRGSPGSDRRIARIA